MIEASLSDSSSGSALASAVLRITVGASGKPEKAPLPLEIRIYREFLTNMGIIQLLSFIVNNFFQFIKNMTYKGLYRTLKLW